jgi:hypothetical protein
LWSMFTECYAHGTKLLMQLVIKPDFAKAKYSQLWFPVEVVIVKVR